MNLKEILEFFKDPTKYEAAHGIDLSTSWELYRDLDQVKLYLRKKTDGSLTLLIVYYTGLEDKWLGWIPTDLQCMALLDQLPPVYKAINKHNREIAKKRG